MLLMTFTYKYIVYYAAICTCMITKEQWAQSMGVATMANKSTPFMMLVGCATQF